MRNFKKFTCIPMDFWNSSGVLNRGKPKPSANKWIWPVCWNFVYVMRAWAISRTTCLSNKYKSSARVEKHKIIIYKSSGELTISYGKMPNMHKPTQTSPSVKSVRLDFSVSNFLSISSETYFHQWNWQKNKEQFCKSSIFEW